MPDLKLTQDKNDWRRQLGGILAGGVIGGALAVLFPDLAGKFGIATVVLWSAVAGGVLSSLSAFIRAGAALTHSPSRLLNLLVGLGLPTLLLILFWILVRSLRR